MRSTCLAIVQFEVRSVFCILKYVCHIVVKRFTFTISSPNEFLLTLTVKWRLMLTKLSADEDRYNVDVCKT